MGEHVEYVQELEVAHELVRCEPDELLQERHRLSLRCVLHVAFVRVDDGATAQAVNCVTLPRVRWRGSGAAARLRQCAWRVGVARAARRRRRRTAAAADRLRSACVAA